MLAPRRALVHNLAARHFCDPRKPAMRRCLITLWLFFSAVSSALAVGPDPGRDWRTITTDHFRIHYPAEVRAGAQLAARIAEEAHARIAPAFDWTPRGGTDIVLLAGIDIANGFATAFPFNHSGIYLSPPDEGELLQNEDWLRLVIIHEYTHIVHMDKVAGAPAVFRAIFGRLFWFFPNVLQPAWLIEGLATWQESDPEHKIGRLRNSHFDALMRAEVQSGLKSLREINADGRGFPLNRMYLYGAYFYDFLAERYGADAPYRMVAGYSRNLIPFRVHNAPREVTGKQMDVLWEEYLDWLRQRFGDQLRRIEATGPTVGQTLQQAFSLADPARAADGVTYFVRGNGYVRAQIVRRSVAGDEEVLDDVAYNARLAAGPGGRLLAVKHDVVGNYDLSGDLHVYAPEAGWTQLTHGARLRLAAFLPDGSGFVAVQQTDDGLRLVRLDRAGEVGAVLATLRPGETVSGLDVAATGAVAWTQNRDRRWLLRGLHSPWPGEEAATWLDDPAIKHSPRFAADGRLYLVADYGNVPNVWALDGERRQLTRVSHTRTAITGLSGASAGVMVAVELAGDGERLLALPIPGGATQGGEAKVEARPVVQAEGSARLDGAPAQPPVHDTPYQAWSSLWPRAWFPSLNTADGALAVGVQVFGQDAVGWHQYTASPMFETTQGELLGAFDYVYDDRHYLSLTREMVVRLTREPKKGQIDIAAYSTQRKAQWVSLLPYERLTRRLALGFGATHEVENLTCVEGPILWSVGSRRFTCAEGERVKLFDERLAAVLLHYDSRAQQRLSEGPSQGLEATFYAEDYDVFGSPHLAGRVYRLDGRAFVPLGRSVMGLNYREGRADEQARGFVLGGQKTAADSTRLEIGERDYTLRGYTSGIAAGQRVRLGSVEWRMPLSDVDRHLMVPPIGLNRVSGNLFWEAAKAWDVGDDARSFRAVGFEALAEIKLGYLLGLQLRAGVAKALDGDKDSRAYARIGRAF